MITTTRFRKRSCWLFLHIKTTEQVKTSQQYLQSINDDRAKVHLLSYSPRFLYVTTFPTYLIRALQILIAGMVSVSPSHPPRYHPHYPIQSAFSDIISPPNYANSNSIPRPALSIHSQPFGIYTWHKNTSLPTRLNPQTGQANLIIAAFPWVLKQRIHTPPTQTCYRKA